MTSLVIGGTPEAVIEGRDYSKLPTRWVTKGQQEDEDKKDSGYRLAVPVNHTPGFLEYPHKHYHYPQLFKTFQATSNKDLQRINDNLNWREALEKRGFYFAKLPIAPHYVTNTEVKVVDLVFSLQSEIMTHTEFYNEFYQSGAVKLSLSKPELRRALRDTIDANRSLALFPKSIQLTDVHSTLPISWDATFHSRNGEKNWVLWSDAHGVSNRDDVVRGPLNQVIHTLVPPYAQWRDQETSMYNAPQIVNTAEFNEYINVDFRELKRRIDTWPTTKSMKTPVYQVPVPNKDETNFSLEFWFLLVEWPYVVQLTHEHAYDTNRYMNTIQRDGTREFLVVSQAVVLELYKQRKQEFDQEKFLMSINQLQLELRPLLGTIGWENLKDIAKARTEQYTSYDTKDVAQFTATVRMYYERYSAPIVQGSEDSVYVSAYDRTNNQSMKAESNDSGFLSSITHKLGTVKLDDVKSSFFDDN